MTKDSIHSAKIHHGHNIRQVRRSMGLSIEKLAQDAGITPQMLTIYETNKIIDNNMLEKFAGVFQVPVEALKYMEKDTPSIYIENNTFSKNQNVSNVGNYNVDDSSSNVFNPIDVIVDLYERLLKATHLNIDDMKKRLAEVERKLHQQ